MPSKSLKTPLRYPGGKSRAITKLFQHLPNMNSYKEYREPFIGGGSMAIAITQAYPHLSVWVNDLYEPLVNFWVQLQNSGVDLMKQLIESKQEHNTPDLAKDLFLKSKDSINDNSVSDLDRAVAFYIVNKCSFSGLTESSSFSSQASVNNFSMAGIEKLVEYSKVIRNWRITCFDYSFMMDGYSDAFMYLDPPYDIKDNLYGRKGSMHKGFDHDKFASDCDSNRMDTLISYNSDQLVKDRFTDWNQFEFDHTYTMRSVGDYMKDQGERKELVLTNYMSDEQRTKLEEFYSTV